MDKENEVFVFAKNIIRTSCIVHVLEVRNVIMSSGTLDLAADCQAPSSVSRMHSYSH